MMKPKEKAQRKETRRRGIELSRGGFLSELLHDEVGAGLAAQ